MQRCSDRRMAGDNNPLWRLVTGTQPMCAALNGHNFAPGLCTRMESSASGLSVDGPTHNFASRYPSLGPDLRQITSPQKCSIIENKDEPQRFTSHPPGIFCPETNAVVVTVHASP
eukprot:1159097-Pelagomonas_calceolata.AAC.14